MVWSTTTTAEQVNIDTLLPTHLKPQRAYTFPPLHHHPSNNQTIPSKTNDNLTTFGMRTWPTHIKEHARVVGLIVAIMTLVVTVIGIIVGAVVTVVIK
jgi:hypothetical protein